MLILHLMVLSRLDLIGKTMGVVHNILRGVIRPAIRSVSAPKGDAISWSAYWETLISATVETAAPTHVVLTFPKAVAYLGKDDFKIAGFTISSASWTASVLTLVLSAAVDAADNVIVVFTRAAGAVRATNNVSYAAYINTLYAGDLVANYSLEEPSLNVMNDVSGNGNHGAYAGLRTQNQSGINGSKCILAQESTYCDVFKVGFRAAFNPLEGHVGVWMKANTADFWNKVNYICHLRNDANNQIIFNTEATGGLVFYYIANSVSKFVQCPAPKGTGWFYLSASWSDSGDTIKLYVNGILQHTETGIGSWAGGLAGYAYFGATAAGETGYYDNYFVLDAMPLDADVFAAFKAQSLVMFEGDSRSVRKVWTANALATGFGSNYFGWNKRALANLSASGDGVVQMAARAAVTNAMIISTDDILIVWCGVNSSSSTAQQIYDGLKNYCIAAKTAGWSKVIICTEIDAQDATRISDGWSAKYLDLNTLIRADHSFADAVADLGAEANLQDATNVTYFNADKVHLQTAGYTIVGNVVGAALATLA